MSKFSDSGKTGEIISIFMGVIAIITSVIFFLIKFQVMNFNFNTFISDEIYMWFFAGTTLVSGIILLAGTIGLIGAR